MRIITALHQCGKREHQVPLIAVYPAGKINRGAMIVVLFHLQADIAHRNLLAIFMLKKEHAIGNL